MRVFLVVLLLALAACSSPGIKFLGVKPVRVDADGSVFDVYSNGWQVQAIRLNPEYLPKLSDVVARAIMAIEQATGCLVDERSLKGDWALIEADIVC